MLSILDSARALVGRRGAWRIVAAALLGGCASQAPISSPTAQACAPAANACAPCNCAKPPPEQPPPKPGWKPAAFAQLTGWSNEAQQEAWAPFLASCKSLRRQSAWQSVCADAQNADPAQARAFFESRLTPWIRDAAPGIITGYYEPLLNGSRNKKAPYLYAAFGAPDDLLTIDLGDLRPDLKGQRLRGRVEGRKVVPYYSREQIEAAAQSGAPAGLATSKPLLYVDDPVELFFLMIQGSGRVKLDSGEMVHLNYADQNGYPYKSVGRYLIDQGEMKLEQASMQGIKAWAQSHPERLNEILNYNPSYVFFRESRAGDEGPQGALGVPLTAMRSIAVDPRMTPLGAPVWLSTTRPNSSEPLQRLMLAQDTGGAINGANRADFFWGFGEEATREAGRMRQQGELYVLWPKDAGPPPQ
ncbi:MAG TPA: murein transglycosylase A [Burkholderiales bacterium]